LLLFWTIEKSGIQWLKKTLIFSYYFEYFSLEIKNELISESMGNLEMFIDEKTERNVSQNLVSIFVSNEKS
jgi:hypothetical protein